VKLPEVVALIIEPCENGDFNQSVLFFIET